MNLYFLVHIKGIQSDLLFIVRMHKSATEHFVYAKASESPHGVSSRVIMYSCSATKRFFVKLCCIAVCYKVLCSARLIQRVSDSWSGPKLFAKLISSQRVEISGKFSFPKLTAFSLCMISLLAYHQLQSSLFHHLYVLRHFLVQRLLFLWEDGHPGPYNGDRHPQG